MSPIELAVSKGAPMTSRYTNSLSKSHHWVSCCKTERTFMHLHSRWSETKQSIVARRFVSSAGCLLRSQTNQTTLGCHRHTRFHFADIPERLNNSISAFEKPPLPWGSAQMKRSSFPAAASASHSHLAVDLRANTSLSVRPPAARIQLSALSQCELT